MTNEMIELARRAVACEGWRWMCGMAVHHPRYQYPLRLVEVVDLGDHDIVAEAVVLERATGGNGVEMIRPHEIWDSLPVLTDPATLGCLIALVSEVLGCHVWVKKDGARYTAMYGRFDYASAAYKTEAHALVTALEAAGGGA